jgi:orotidine-5'-phosphate decarboxylase
MTTRSERRSPLAGRPPLALALDMDDLGAARRLAQRLAEFFPVAKVGLELFAAAGAAAVAALQEDGFEVFVDLKLHDIPTTVERTCRVLGRLGPRYVTLHAQGGAAMLAAGVEGLAHGAEDAGLQACRALGVTVLTSEPAASPELVAERAALAARSGCAGVVLAAADLPFVASLPTGFLRVVPGVRPVGSPAHDQGRPTTPAAAIAAGAGLLVVGRAVTAAPDPLAAARALASEVDKAIRRGSA